MRLALIALLVGSFVLTSLGACSDAPELDPAAPATASLRPGDRAVPADSGALAPRLTTDADGRPVLSWVEPTADGHRLRAATWTGDGWAAPTTAAEGADWFVNWADTPGVIPTAGGALAHTLTRFPGGESPYAYDIRVGPAGGESRLLHDDGRAAEHGFVSAVALPDGRAGLVWLDGRNQAGGGHGHDAGAMTLRWAALAPDGTKTDEAELDAQVCDCCPTTAVATASGVVVAYRDRTDAEIRDIAVVRRVDGAWTEPVVPHADGWEIAGCPVNGPALAARDDRVALAWYTAADSARVRLALSDDGGATWGPAVDLAQAPLGRVDVAFLDDGRAAVSWLEGSGDTAELRLRTVTPDGALGESRTVATVPSGRASGVPHIAALGDRLLAAWTDPDAGLIRSAVVSP